jgi:hypothetical protein
MYAQYIVRVWAGAPPLALLLVGLIGESARAQPASPIYVSANAALTAAPSTDAIAVRTGFASAGDSPPVTYIASGSTCSLNAGAGDGGSQAPTSDGGCWNAKFLGSLRIEWWGLAPVPWPGAGSAKAISLYVASGAAAPAGNDQAGLNTCVQSAHPCLTWQHAVNEAQLFDVEGGNVVIHDTDANNQSFPESVSINNPLRGAGNRWAIPQAASISSGYLDPSQIILDGNFHATIVGNTANCYAVESSNNAIVGTTNITIAATGPTQQKCQGDLFAQLGGGINIYSGTILGATEANGCKVHAENTVYGIQIWQPYTIKGNGNCFASAGASALVLISGGVGTITGNPILSGNFIFVGAGSVFQTNIPNPWGSAPGAIGGRAFAVTSGGTIEPQGNAIAWPGATGELFGTGAYRSWPSSSVLATSGLGAGGAAAIKNGSTAVGAEIALTAGSGAAGSGAVKVSFPFLVGYSNGSPAVCAAYPTNDGTGAWQNGAIFQGTAYERSPAAGMFFYWSNGGANLTNGSTYTFAISCSAG